MSNVLNKLSKIWNNRLLYGIIYIEILFFVIIFDIGFIELFFFDNIVIMVIYCWSCGGRVMYFFIVSNVRIC